MLILTFLTHCVPCLLQHEKLQSAPGSRVGTPAYLAPEVILTTKGKTYDGKVAPSTFKCLQTHSLIHSTCALDLPACFHAALLHNYQNFYNEGNGPSINYPQGTKSSPQALHTHAIIFTLHAGYHS